MNTSWLSRVIDVQHSLIMLPEWKRKDWIVCAYASVYCVAIANPRPGTGLSSEFFIANGNRVGNGAV